MKYSKLKNSALALAVLTIINSLWISHVGAEDAFYDDIQIVKVGDQAKSADSQDKAALKEAKARAKEEEKAAKAKSKEELESAKQDVKAQAKKAKEKAQAEARSKKEEERARKKEDKKVQKLDQAPLQEPIQPASKVLGAYEDENLVPLDYFLASLPYKWTSNQWKTQYTIYLPRVTLSDGIIHMDPNGKTEPLALNYVKRSTIAKDIKGNEIKSAKEGNFVDTTAFKLLVDGMPLPKARILKNPVAWAFDPLTTEANPSLMHEGGTNIMSPSWFILQSNGLKASPRISTDYVRTYRDKGYQVWPLVTNQFDPSFTASILGQSGSGLWATYAQQLVQYALAYGFEGYNFDFENIHESHRDQLSHFVAYLSDYLHQYGIYTSIDVTGYSTSEYWSRVYDRPALSKSVDYVVHMAYDEVGHSSPTAGPVASYPWVRKQTEQMLGEVPANKLVLGIPFYTRIWTESYGRAHSKTLTIADSRNYLKAFEDNVVWNDQLRGYTLTIPSQGLVKKDPRIPLVLNHQSGTVQKIWFEDNKSLEEKLALVNELKLAGFAAWRKGFEDKDINDMIYRYPLYKAVDQERALDQIKSLDQAAESDHTKTDDQAKKSNKSKVSNHIKELHHAKVIDTKRKNDSSLKKDKNSKTIQEEFQQSK